MRLVDAHCHLDEPVLERLLPTLGMIPNLTAISNSVDLESSERNIELGKRFPAIIPFAGIHPEIFARPDSPGLTTEILDGIVEKLSHLLDRARGVGEIGLDPKYGNMEMQEYLLSQILSSAEFRRIPISLHCRETNSKLLDMLTTFNIRGKILFHWFAGTAEEMAKLHDQGIFASFGPSILTSKRMAELVKSADPRFVLTETDSPTSYRSILEAPSTPLLVSSVAFKMGLVTSKPAEEVCELASRNAAEYLSTQD